MFLVVRYTESTDGRTHEVKNLLDANGDLSVLESGKLKELRACLDSAGQIFHFIKRIYRMSINISFLTYGFQSAEISEEVGFSSLIRRGFFFAGGCLSKSVVKAKVSGSELLSGKDVVLRLHFSPNKTRIS